jgi:hypothetical protein
VEENKNIDPQEEPKKNKSGQRTTRGDSKEEGGQKTTRGTVKGAETTKGDSEEGREQQEWTVKRAENNKSGQ